MPDLKPSSNLSIENLKRYLHYQIYIKMAILEKALILNHSVKSPVLSCHGTNVAFN